MIVKHTIGKETNTEALLADVAVSVTGVDARAVCLPAGNRITYGCGGIGGFLHRFSASMICASVK